MDHSGPGGSSDSPGPSQDHQQQDEGSTGDTASWYYDVDDIAEDEDEGDDPDYRDEPDEDEDEDDDFQGMILQAL